MPRNIRTARGDVVDFDTIIIKQQIAQAPMNIDVERRKNFIDSKESKVRGRRVQPPLITSPASSIEDTSTNFELDNSDPIPAGLAPVEAIPIIPTRTKNK